MYFVNENLIISRLNYYSEQLEHITQLEELNTVVEKKAVERMAHTMMESILDVGNALIDGFIMRDAGSYEDIIDILADEKVLEQKCISIFKHLITYRKMLVRDYMQTDVYSIFEFIKMNEQPLQSFNSQVRHYLETQKHTYHTFIK